MQGREPVLTRDGSPIVDAKGRRSYVTSAGAGPSVGKHILLAYLPPEHAVAGAELAVEYLGERYPGLRRGRRLDAALRPRERPHQRSAHPDHDARLRRYELSQVNEHPEVLFYSRIRRSPYFYASRRHGVQMYSFYNHMYHPRHYGDPVEEYWQLLNGVTLWDVGVERQVEITGPDAFTFTNMLVPRDLTKCEVGQCKYVFVTSPEGGILNDPVLLRLEENRFWLSLADSDILLWA